MSENSPPLSPWIRLPETDRSNVSPHLDDFDGLGDDPSLLGRKIVSSPDSDAGSATHPVSLGVSVEESKRDLRTRFRIPKELDKILTEWGTRGRAPKRFLKFPKDTNRIHEAFVARRCHWRKHFSLRRVERARARRTGSTLLGSSSSSNHTDFSAFKSTRLTLRDKIALAKKKTAEAVQHTEEQQLAEVDTHTEVEPDTATRTHIESATPVPDDATADQSSSSLDSVRAALNRYGSTLAIRPSTSSVIRHEETSHRDGSRKRGTDSRRESRFDERAPKQPRRSSSDRETAAIDTDWTAASMLSKITLPGTRFPSPNTLQGEGSYTEMARHGVQFISHLNKMTLDYEAESKANRRQLEDA
ncbi:unnamed protein product [Arabis nemorensis]|uniref:Uncharacterized protein n=1 Tax=Arabis nemorensis TaxID=586526 RepID=A0A565AZ54_9BRAS|nr:unnamed protein product [Arabis nemorensis]